MTPATFQSYLITNVLDIDGNPAQSTGILIAQAGLEGLIVEVETISGPPFGARIAFDPTETNSRFGNYFALPPGAVEAFVLAPYQGLYANAPGGSNIFLAVNRFPANVVDSFDLLSVI